MSEGGVEQSHNPTREIRGIIENETAVLQLFGNFPREFYVRMKVYGLEWGRLKAEAIVPRDEEGAEAKGEELSFSRSLLV